MSINRREFLQSTAAAGIGLSVGWPAASADAKEKLPTRVLGKTKVKVPILGLGTVALGAIKEEKEAHDLVNKAIDLGVTYIDTAPAFAGYGKAQAYLKAILKERRKELFIATKSYHTEAKGAFELLKKNLAEMGIEQADLAYAHAIGHGHYEFEKLVGDEGLFAGLEKARKEGLCRFVGMTGHNRPEKFVEVLEKRDVDVVMNAINIVDRHTYNFEGIFWPEARKKEIGLVAMKVYGGAILKPPCKMPEELRQASFRYALSVEGVASNVIGIATIQELEQNVEWAKNFKPLTAEEAKKLKEKTVPLARDWGVHLDALDPQGEKKRPVLG